MHAAGIERVFRESLSAEISLLSEGVDRFRVLAPFGFDDGDEFVIVLKQEQGRWLLSDEAHTYMHLSYDLDLDDLRQGARGEILGKTLAMFEIEDRRGELVLPVRDGEYGGALCAFVQGLVRIANLSYLSRERVRDTFRDDFLALLRATVPGERLEFDWFDPQRDPEKRYRIDCRVNGSQPVLFLQALSSAAQTRDATIALHQFRRWSVDFREIGVFDDRSKIGKQVRERYTDVCPVQIAHFATQRDELVERVARRLER